jgi:hypothetical protein
MYVHVWGSGVCMHIWVQVCVCVCVWGVVCVRVHAQMEAGACISAYACEGQRLASGVYHSLPHF